jgi:hypothetical protein
MMLLLRIRIESISLNLVIFVNKTVFIKRFSFSECDQINREKWIAFFAKVLQRLIAIRVDIGIQKYKLKEIDK